MAFVEREYVVLAYDTVTGRVVRELPLADEPAWDARLNDTGGGTVTCPLGVSDDWDRYLHEVARPYRYSLAIGLSGVSTDSPLLQAGPMVGYAPDEEPTSGSLPKITFAFKGFWELLDRRLLHNRSWNPAATLITDTSADLTINDSLSNVARTMLDHATSMSFRSGSTLPLDLPPVVASDGNTRTYHGYDMISVGQRLQELTQVDGGPDVFFQPWLTTSGGYRQVRHRAVVGNPYIVQPGVSLRFDYRSNLVKIAINGAADDTSTTAWVKGTGNENAQQYGYATDSSLINQGWPLLDYVDNNHTSALIQSTLDSWAVADVALLGNLPEQWKATVLTEPEPRLGTYIPGSFVQYNVLDHHWIPDGLYTWRLLGLARTGNTQRGTVEQVIQALGAY
jgi:hypothetical protein